MRKTRRRIVAAAAVAASMLGAAALGASPAEASTRTAAGGAPATFQNVLQLPASDAAALQATIDATLRAAHGRDQLGGKQISQYEISFDKGHVIEAFPAPGTLIAPPASAAAIGSDAKAQQYRARAASALAGSARSASGVRKAMGSSSTCPYSYSTKYYCFYQDRNFDGRRVQFQDYYCPGAIYGPGVPLRLSDYNFDNLASSWVNNTNFNIVAYDYYPTSGQMWTEGRVSNATDVYTGYNDRLSSASVC